MTLLQRGLATWIPAFLLLELASDDVLGWAPWPSLSVTVWLVIKAWPPEGWVVAAFSLVLLGHFEEHWPVGLLIAVAAVGVVAFAVHAAVG